MRIKGALNAFVGKQIKDCADQLQEYAAEGGGTMNILDPVVNTGNIDYDPRRLNVHTDEASVITGFVYG